MTCDPTKKLPELTIPTYPNEIDTIFPEEVNQEPLKKDLYLIPLRKSPKSPIPNRLFMDVLPKSFSEATLLFKKSPDIHVAKVSQLVLEYLKIIQSEDTLKIHELNPQPLQKTYSQDFQDILVKDSFQIKSIKDTENFHSKMRTIISSLCLSILNAEVSWQLLTTLQQNLIDLLQKTKEKLSASEVPFDLEKLAKKDFGIGFMITSKRPKDPEFTDPLQISSERSSMVSDLKKILEL